MVSLDIMDISKAYYMSSRYAIIKKIKDWKIDRRMLCFIENFMKKRTLRDAVEDTLLNEATIENGGSGAKHHVVPCSNVRNM
jgi:hypothetical protein